MSKCSASRNSVTACFKFRAKVAIRLNPGRWGRGFAECVSYRFSVKT
ncbi:hypothetical protein [Caudoviricetes sp.]|nr:hypothetical protein [Caudoviricetes sp.]